LSRPLGEPVNGCVARRNLDVFRVDVVGEAADQSDLARNRELHVSVGKSQLDLLAVGDIDADAYDSLWASFPVIRNAPTCLDPFLLPAWANNSVLPAIFRPPLMYRFTAGQHHLPNVIDVVALHDSLPIYLSRPLPEPVNGCVARRNLDVFRVDVVGEAADERRAASELELDRKSVV